MLYACVGFQIKPCKPYTFALQIIFFEKKPKKYGNHASYILGGLRPSKNPLKSSGFFNLVRDFK